jgi:hypothetical protein
VASAALSGPQAADFKIVSDGCSGKPVPVGSSCPIGIAFAPGALGARGATLTVTDDATGSPRSIPLTGTGINAPPVLPVRPVVNGFTMSRTKFRRASFRTPVSARHKRPPRGSSFAYSLSEDATAQIKVTQLVRGRRVGKRCVKATPRVRSHRSCVRSIKRGTLTRHGHVGANTVPFSGRLGRKALPVGRYRATLVASVPGAAGSIPRSVRFTIVRG